MFYSCSKMDEYKEYAEGGEIVYPTKIDSLKILSGKYRAAVTGFVKVNKGMTSYRVYWNNRRDSVVVPVTLTEKIDTFYHVIPNLPEGPLNFEIRSYDDKGHSSVPTFVVGNVYGERFREGLFQRDVLDVKYSADNKVHFTLQDIAKEMGAYGIRVKYTNWDKKIVDTVFLTKEAAGVVSIANYLPGQPFSYSTVYKPEPSAIDTFTFDKYKTINTSKDISTYSLLNYKKPFTSSEYDGNRWGTLYGWITNSAAKNHSYSLGKVGGYASDNGGSAKLESGWGAADIVNGKIHQTITLPAGKYRFFARVSEDAWGGNIPGYIIANRGNSLSDYDNINSSTLLNSRKLTREDNSFEFELTSTTTVSLGYVVNMIGGAYLTIDYFKLEIL